MDGGYALKMPVDAIAEFRILTQSAPPEYGGTGGATTSVVTRAGGNQYHGSLYEFVRNDSFDARNFFSKDVEPLKQNQFGGTLGGPIKNDRIFFFGYYEGFRNDQGMTTTRHGADAAAAGGDFSGMGKPLINFAAGGVPFPGNKLPAPAINPVALNVVNLYPLGNVSPSIYRATLVGKNRVDQAGGARRLQAVVERSDLRALLVLRRLQYQSRSRCAAPTCPAFPTRDDIQTALARGLEHAHLLADADQLAARHVPALQVLFRPAAEPDAAERARVRLPVVERGRRRAAVLQRQRLLAHRRRDYRSAELDAEQLRGAGQRCRGSRARIC